MIHNIEKALGKIKQQKPLILCLTNFVTVEFVANSLLSIGAAPIMSACEDEIESLVKISSAVCLNIGTLDHPFIRLTQRAIDSAQKHKKPIVFDPVGSGATPLRTEAARAIVPFANFVRGNSSEVISLMDPTQKTYGVEAHHTTNEASEAAQHISRNHNSIVIVSGPVDFITNGTQSIHVPFGSPLMQKVTGMGCSLTGIIAAFGSVLEDPLEAASLGVHYFGLCGQVASQKATSPGSFKIAFLDQLHQPDLNLMETFCNS